MFHHIHVLSVAGWVHRAASVLLTQGKSALLFAVSLGLHSSPCWCEDKSHLHLQIPATGAAVKNSSFFLGVCNTGELEARKLIGLPECCFCIPMHGLSFGSAIRTGLSFYLRFHHIFRTGRPVTWASEIVNEKERGVVIFLYFLRPATAISSPLCSVFNITVSFAQLVPNVSR